MQVCLRTHNANHARANAHRACAQYLVDEWFGAARLQHVVRPPTHAYDNRELARSLLRHELDFELPGKNFSSLVFADIKTAVLSQHGPHCHLVICVVTMNLKF